MSEWTARAAQVWEMAQAAAKLLGEGLQAGDRPSMLLNADMPLGLLHELALLAGVPVDACVYFRDGPHVIESFRAEAHGVEIRAQGSRPVTAADACLPGFVSRGPGRCIEPDEVAEQLKGV